MSHLYGALTGLHVACPLIGSDDDTARRRFHVAQAEGCRNGAFAKHSLASPQRDRTDVQVQFVYQIMREEYLEEVTATADL